MVICGVGAMLAMVGACDSKAPDAAKPAASGGANAAAVVPAAFAGSLPPGWAVVVRGGGLEATQHAPHAAFAIGKGQSLSPMVPVAGQSATYTCTLDVAEAGEHRFIVETQGGVGSISVLAKGVEAPVASVATTADGVGRSAWVALNTGPLTVTVKYTRSGDGPARLRTMWERKRNGETPPFLAEPIPVESTSVPKFAFDAVARAQDVARGRVLLGELNCVACHAAPSETAGLIPSRQAPLLEEIGRRASPAWLKKWITDPQSVKPGSGMPTLHGGGHGADAAAHAIDADAITQFLVAPYYTASDENQPVANERPVLEAGKRIYHQVGCVACHGPLTSPSDALENPGASTEIPKVQASAPFGDIVGKWRPIALSAFLRDPLKAHPSGRMPNLKLGPEDGDLLANYLVSSWTRRGPDGKVIPTEAIVIDKAKVEAGRAAFVAHGCSACHQMGPNSPKMEVAVRSTPLKELAGKVDAWQGCLNPGDHATPRYTLSDDDRRALGAAIKSLPGVQANAPLEVAKATFDALNCRACHSKEGVGGPADAIRPYFTTINDVELGDEGRIPPRLTNVGWKLTTQWLRQVLTEGGAARPYMATRMPQYGAANLGALAEHLAGLEGISADVQEPEPMAGPELAAAGRAIVGEKGLNCISCHVFGDHASAGTPGPAITSFGERLRFSWFESYAHAPTRFKPGTRMPSFWMTGTSAATSILAGDSTKQLQALWAYFQQGEFAAVPEGIKTDTGLALKPVKAPMVFRTFLKDAGSRGIAVGWPGAGPHFGFDAEQVRLRDAWTGDFVDASSAWRGRGGMKADGQGPEVWTAPEGAAVVVAAELTAWPETMGPDAGIRYKGYEFNAKREPTFVSTIKTTTGNATMREWFGPTQTKGRLFARRIVVSGHEHTAVWVNAGPDGDVAKVEGGEASTVELGGRKFVKVQPKNENDVTITLVVGKAKSPASPATPAAAPKGAGS
jgi:cbb3-type cytochrome oxidase cytochrome c subunit